MSETSLSLLQRLRSGNDQTAWQRLDSLYAPLIRGWLQRHLRMDAHDVDDVVQEVMTVLVRRIGEFDRQRTGSFRTWLRHMAINCLRQFQRRRKTAGSGDSGIAEQLQALEDPHSSLSERWDREHDEHVMKLLLQQLQAEFRGNTWQAFELTALKGLSASEAAETLKITPNAVFIARSRVLARLRTEAEGFLDEV